MSTVERSGQSGSNLLPGAMPPQSEPPSTDCSADTFEAPRSLASALAPIRRRVLCRVFLRWYWVCALACEAAALAALLILKPWLSVTGHFISAVALLLVPVVVAGLRCLAVRLPVFRLAQLVDERCGLQERVASAVEASSRADAPLKPSRMLTLLTRDALDAISAVDTSRLLPLKRDAILAAAALTATVALWFWHVPDEIGIALSGKNSQPGALQQFIGERHPVAVKPAANHLTPPARHSMHPQEDKPGAPAATKPRPQNPGSASGDAKPMPSPQGGANQNRDQASNPQVGGAAQRKSVTSGVQAKPDDRASAAAKRGASQRGAGSPSQPNGQSRPGANSSKPGAVPGQRAQRQNGQTSDGQGTQPKATAGKTQQSKNSGKQNSAPNHAIDRSRQQNVNPHAASGTRNSQGRQPAQGQGQGAQTANAHASPQSGNSSKSPGSGKSGSAPGTNQTSRNGQAHPGSPLATGGHGKPLPITPRSLPAVANRSRFSFRLPKATGGTLKASPEPSSRGATSARNAAGSHLSKIPYGSGGSDMSASPDAPQASDVEQNPRIPAGYRTLVKRYFNNGSGAAR